MAFAADSHTGMVRPDNQDSYAAFEWDGAMFGLVADGMGGHVGGKTASQMVVESICSQVKESCHVQLSEAEVCELFVECFKRANLLVFERAQKEPELAGMGTTATLVMVRDGRIVVAHAGDSRAYLVADGCAVQMTADHTLIQDLMDKGEITRQQAQQHPKRHMITRALGTEADIQTDIYTGPYEGQTVIVCSDGLTNMLTDKKIAAVAGRSESLESIVQTLVSEANRAGGLDNVTVVAMRGCEQGGCANE